MKVKALPHLSGQIKLDQYRPEIEALLVNGSTQRFIARRYHTTVANLCNWLNKNNLRVKPPVKV